MHVMLDLETLGVDPQTAPITQIGAYTFALDHAHVGEQFSMKVRPDDQLGRTVSYATLRWWLDTNPDLLQAILDPAAAYIPAALTSFYSWYKNLGPVEGIWAKGPTFDVSMLDCAYRQYKMEPPWDFRGVRCVRTILALLPPDEQVAVRDEVNASFAPGEMVAHDALSDAIWQAREVQAAYRRLTVRQEALVAG